MKTDKQLFQEYVSGENWFTSKVERYGHEGRFVYELSSGKDITGDVMYGVTVVEIGRGRRSDKSRGLHSLKEAEEYIKTLNN